MKIRFKRKEHPRGRGKMHLLCSSPKIINAETNLINITFSAGVFFREKGTTINIWGSFHNLPCICELFFSLCVSFSAHSVSLCSYLPVPLEAFGGSPFGTPPCVFVSWSTLNVFVWEGLSVWQSPPSVPSSFWGFIRCVSLCVCVCVYTRWGRRGSYTEKPRGKNSREWGGECWLAAETEKDPCSLPLPSLSLLLPPSGRWRPSVSHQPFPALSLCSWVS